MKRLVACFILGALAVSFAGCTASEPTRATPSPDVPVLRTYASRDGRFSLQYSSDWVIRESFSQGLVSLVPGDLAPGAVGLITFGREPANPVDPALTPAEFERQALAQARSVIGPFELIDSSDTTLGGKPARQWHFRIRIGERIVQQTHIFAVVGKEFWTAGYAASDADFKRRRDGAEAIVRSARFERP